MSSPIVALAAFAAVILWMSFAFLAWRRFVATQTQLDSVSRARAIMATISVSSLFMVGQQVAKYCLATLAFVSPILRTGGSLPTSSSTADDGRTASSTSRALSEVRSSPGLLLCLAFNILLITGVAVLCISGYGFAMGLSIVILALLPALMLLNIGLFAWIEQEQRPSQLRAVSTSMQASQRSETPDEKYPSIVPEKFETALGKKAELQEDSKTQTADRYEQ